MARKPENMSYGTKKKKPQQTKRSTKKPEPNEFTIPPVELFNLENSKLPDEVIRRMRTYKCTCCGNSSDKPDDLFPKSFSNLYEAWGYHLPICKKCLNLLYDNYTKPKSSLIEPMSPYEACRRICSLYDIYYSADIVKLMLENSKPDNRMGGYLSKSQLSQYANKTYANTLNEDKIRESKSKVAVVDDENEISQKDLDFWGYVFTAEDIKYLNNEYDRWTATNECKNQAQVTIFRQISILSLQILKCYQEGKSSASYQKQLNDYMSSGNLQPKQNNENTFAETNTLALFLKRIENERPVAKCSPEFEDVDGIKRYISVWFLGHLAKMIGILDKMGTKWKKLYEDEIDALSAKPPTYFEGDENEETSFEDMFNK